MKRGNLEGRIDIRVTKEEREEIQEHAEASGLSILEYVRRRTLGRRVDSVTDVKMLSELRRQGGLLKKIFIESNGVYREETAVVIGNINKIIESLEKKVLGENENSYRLENR